MAQQQDFGGHPTKAAFVRAQAADMPAKQVVAMAKEKGFGLSDKQVYKIRRLAKKRAGKKSRAASRPTKKGRRVAARAANGKYGTKSAFIRSMPRSMSAADVVKKAAAQGMKLTTGQVYTARSQAKKPGRAPGRPPKVVATPAARPAPSTSGTAAEVALRRLVLEMGLPAVKDLLARVERKLLSP